MGNIVAFGHRSIRGSAPADGDDPVLPGSDRAVYTVAEVARLLTLSRGTAYALVRDGTIPARRLGCRWVIPRDAAGRQKAKAFPTRRQAAAFRAETKRH